MTKVEDYIEELGAYVNRLNALKNAISIADLPIPSEPKLDGFPEEIPSKAAKTLGGSFETVRLVSDDLEQLEVRLRIAKENIEWAIKKIRENNE